MKIFMSGFKNKVLIFIQSIPRSKVASYGQVAIMCGKPHGAREVGRILRNLDISETFLPGIHSPAKIPRKGRSEAGRKGKPFPGFPSEVVPWWRVVNNQGVISIKGNWTASKDLQAKLLQKEGVKVNKDFTLDIEKYRYELK